VMPHSKQAVAAYGCDGKAFHTRWPAAEKLLSPKLWCVRLADKSCIWRRPNGKRAWRGEVHPRQKTAALQRPVITRYISSHRRFRCDCVFAAQHACMRNQCRLGPNYFQRNARMCGTAFSSGSVHLPGIRLYVNSRCFRACMQRGRSHNAHSQLQAIHDAKTHCFEFLSMHHQTLVITFLSAITYTSIQSWYHYSRIVFTSDFTYMLLHNEVSSLYCLYWEVIVTSCRHLWPVSIKVIPGATGRQPRYTITHLSDFVIVFVVYSCFNM